MTPAALNPGGGSRPICRPRPRRWVRLFIALGQEVIPVFNDSHKSYIQSVFQAVDESLASVVRFVDPAQSPLSGRAADATPAQARISAEWTVRLRDTMCRLLAEQNIALPAKKISSVWAARTAIIAARIAVEELDLRTVRGYGPLTDEDARALQSITAQLIGELNEMERALVTAAENLRAGDSSHESQGPDD